MHYLKKQIIDDYTFITAESFDNLLGSNNFSCEWTSYFFYDRRGNLSLTTSGYCFKNWPTDDILLSFNQSLFNLSVIILFPVLKKSFVI